MSLRRTALARKSELRRTTPMRRGVKARGDRVVAAVARRSSSTGPSAAVRLLVVERAGFCCELCGASLHDGTSWTRSYSVHHRQARGMGGTSVAAANEPTNLLLVCGTGTTGCHGTIEQARTVSYAFGWLVRHPNDPATTPVFVHTRPAPVLLTTDGLYQEVDA